MFTGVALNQDANHVRLLLLVARRYYEDGAHQSEIAEEIHASRPTVSRLLSQARRTGIVQIRIGHVLERTSELESRLKDTFGLKAAFVCEPRPGQDALDAVAHRAAESVPELVGRNAVVGMSNGTTLAAMVAAMSTHRRPDSCVVQMIGSLGQETQLIDSPELCRRLAENLGGTYRVMPVPLVMRSAGLADALRREQSVATTLALGSRVDVAFVGIGLSNESGSGQIFDGWMNQRTIDRLTAAGVVGHVLGHHFDVTGLHVESELCRRTVGVSLERLAQVPLVVGVAAGPSKVTAIRGALAGRYVSALVTDTDTAESLLGGATSQP